jgi:hypothetical protein
MLPSFDAGVELGLIFFRQFAILNVKPTIALKGMAKDGPCCL